MRLPLLYNINELGQMVIAEDGESCTYGRRDCLKAHASTLERAVKRATGEELDPEAIFACLCSRSCNNFEPDSVHFTGITRSNLNIPARKQFAA